MCRGGRLVRFILIFVSVSRCDDSWDKDDKVSCSETLVSAFSMALKDFFEDVVLVC